MGDKKDNRTTYSIGEVAKKLDLKLHVVRYYCEVHNIHAGNTDGKHRRFTPYQVSQLNDIKVVRDLGWPEVVKIVQKYKRLKFKEQ